MDTPVVKRGRKPKEAGVRAVSKRAVKSAAVFTATDDAAQANNSDDENIVLNLKVYNMQDVEKDIKIEGYDCHSDTDHFLDNVFNDNNVDSECNDNDANTLDTGLKVIDILKDFEEKNKYNEWPTNTSIHCYWCCHKFNNTPFGIPVKYINNKYHVFGCFCSLECCASYNMDGKDTADDIWERGSLINMLARSLGYRNFIKPAPSRLALKMFGGHMDIEEFRDYCLTNKIININFPPMMTMTQQIEEINESDINSDYRYIPLDTDRINKYKEKIKLKRNKPVTNFKNTLDHTMNLKYS
jgi:hypothetical protein